MIPTGAESRVTFTMQWGRGEGGGVRRVKFPEKCMTGVFGRRFDLSIQLFLLCGSQIQSGTPFRSNRLYSIIINCCVGLQHIVSKNA